MGIPETTSYQIRVRGLMCINLKVLDTQKVENHWSRDSRLKFKKTFSYTHVSKRQSFPETRNDLIDKYRCQ